MTTQQALTAMSAANVGEINSKLPQVLNIASRISRMGNSANAAYIASCAREAASASAAYTRLRNTPRAGHAPCPECPDCPECENYNVRQGGGLTLLSYFDGYDDAIYGDASVTERMDTVGAYSVTLVSGVVLKFSPITGDVVVGLYVRINGSLVELNPGVQNIMMISADKNHPVTVEVQIVVDGPMTYTAIYHSGVHNYAWTFVPAE